MSEWQDDWGLDYDLVPQRQVLQCIHQLAYWGCSRWVLLLRRLLLSGLRLFQLCLARRALAPARVVVQMLLVLKRRCPSRQSAVNGCQGIPPFDAYMRFSWPFHVRITRAGVQCMRMPRRPTISPTSTLFGPCVFSPSSSPFTPVFPVI
jgi:hypothetical protein